MHMSHDILNGWSGVKRYLGGAKSSSLSLAVGLILRDVARFFLPANLTMLGPRLRSGGLSALLTLSAPTRAFPISFSSFARRAIPARPATNESDVGDGETPRPTELRLLILASSLPLRLKLSSLMAWFELEDVPVASLATSQLFVPG